MSIYREDTISRALGVRPIHEVAQDFDFNVLPNEDNSTDTWSFHPLKGVPVPEEVKKAISQTLRGNKNALGKTWTCSEEFKEKQRQRKLKNNPMFDAVSVEKIRQHALKKHSCPHCNKEMNAGNLSQHISARHK